MLRNKGSGSQDDACNTFVLVVTLDDVSKRSALLLRDFSPLSHFLYPWLLVPEYQEGLMLGLHNISILWRHVMLICELINELSVS